MGQGWPKSGWSVQGCPNIHAPPGQAEPRGGVPGRLGEVDLSRLLAAHAGPARHRPPPRLLPGLGPQQAAVWRTARNRGPRPENIGRQAFGLSSRTGSRRAWGSPHPRPQFQLSRTQACRELTTMSGLEARVALPAPSPSGEQAAPGIPTPAREKALRPASASSFKAPSPSPGVTTRANTEGREVQCGGSAGPTYLLLLLPLLPLLSSLLSVLLLFLLGLPDLLFYDGDILFFR